MFDLRYKKQKVQLFLNNLIKFIKLKFHMSLHIYSKISVIKNNFTNRDQNNQSFQFIH